MKNSNKGFGKFEVLTLFVLLIGISAYLCYTTLGGATSQKIATMKKSANSLLSAVTVNAESFSSFDVVYLDEVVREGFLGKVKSPFSAGDCSVSESKVYLGAKPTVTLKCDNYLIEKADFNGGSIKVYKVGNWNENDVHNSEKVTLFNCSKDGKKVFDEYYESEYFVYKVNEAYGTDYYSADDVSTCEVEEKTFYRTKEILK